MLRSLHISIRLVTCSFFVRNKYLNYMCSAEQSCSPEVSFGYEDGSSSCRSNDSSCRQALLTALEHCSSWHYSI